jgi:predicted metal-binding membrane protein
MFLWMWAVMMVAMMLPSLTPVLVQYRRSGGTVGDTWRVAGAYFFVWTIFGAVAYPIGAVLANVATNHEAFARAVPLMTGAVLILAGLAQFTPWKARHLTCCRTAPCCGTDQTSAAWRAGTQLGVHCAKCCLGIMIVMLVAGSMDLGVMLVITILITLERVLPRPAMLARITGALMIVAGIYAAMTAGS